ncbi:MAG: hypothetical protein LUD81_08790, partial [Clostridiales bacterium]|nr:hypothetical protein [Clostridiales bacterium]
MGSLLFLIAVIAFFKWQGNQTKKKIDNYPLNKVDSVKMSMDIYASPKQKQINMINGKYDIT